MLLKLLRLLNKKYNVLSDLQGNDFVFFRGNSPYPFNNGRFFTNCFREAKGFANDGIVYKTAIQTKSPLIIDAKAENGYYYYDTIKIDNVLIYPNNARGKLMKYSKSLGSNQCYLSTDEILSFVLINKEFDCVIIRNVREGILTQREYNGLPVHVYIFRNIHGVERNSCVLLEQIRVLDTDRLKKKLGWLDCFTMREIDRAIRISVGLKKEYN